MRDEILSSLLCKPVLGPTIAGVATVIAVLLFWWLLPGRSPLPTLLEYGEYYEPVARSLLAGDGFVLPDGTPALRYPPGHPLVLATVFGIAGWVGISESLALRLLILMCSGLTAALLFLTARDFWGGERGFATPVVFAVYPLALWLTLQPISEMTFLPVFAFAMWLFWRGALGTCHASCRLTAAGMAVGASMLIRPAAIGLGVVLAGSLLMSDREIKLRVRLLRASYLLFGCILVVLPWEVSVFAQTGRIVPLSTGGPSSIHDGLTFAVRDKGYRSAQAPPREVAGFMHAVDRGYLEAGSVRIFPAAVESAKTHRVGAVHVGLWKAVRAWYATDSRRQEGWVLAVQIPVLSLLVLASIRAVRLGGEKRRLAFVLCSIVGYFWLVTTAALSIVRYMTPTICLWFLVLPSLFVGRLERLDGTH